MVCAHYGHHDVALVVKPRSISGFWVHLEDILHVLEKWFCDDNIPSLGNLKCFISLWEQYRKWEGGEKLPSVTACSAVLFAFSKSTFPIY
jgi:hypothetical protein